jgi:hypothetical protein
MLRKWYRGGLITASIFTLFFVGLGMQGKVYSFNTGDLLEMLAFVGDIGNGLLYGMGHLMDWGQGAINRATADYGTKYIVCAGLLNVMSAIDAYHIALGKKQ